MRARWFAALLLGAIVTSAAEAQQPRDTGPYPHFGLQASVGEGVDIGLGVRYGQGYFFARPVDPYAPKPGSAVSHAR